MDVKFEKFGNILSRAEMKNVKGGKGDCITYYLFLLLF
jgi:hypothetical protein